MALVPSYSPPAGDPLGDTVRGRAWTYDSPSTGRRAAASGDIDGAAAILDPLQELQRPDGALDASYDLAGEDPAGPLRSGNQAWVGLAALASRAARTRLLAGLAAGCSTAARGARLRPRRAGRLLGLDGAQPRGARVFAGLGEDVSRLDRAIDT